MQAARLEKRKAAKQITIGVSSRNGLPRRPMRLKDGQVLIHQIAALVLCWTALDLS